jgi:zinc transporter ZupT
MTELLHNCISALELSLRSSSYLSVQGHGPTGHKECQGLLAAGSKETSVLLGLILHAAADGLAVGVASVSPSIKLAVAVGMAMVLHKGPVSFGLGVSLVSQKLPTDKVILVCCVQCACMQRTCPA